MILHPRGSVRAGITLLECLTAIFIMGVGLLAILTLFPLGALSMARAVRDDRAAAAGANAAALANAMDLRNDPTVVPFLTSTPAGFLPPDPNGPGYPVLVDPVYATLASSSVGAYPGVTPGVLRSGVSYASGSPQAIARWFTFPDEMTFAKTGQPTGGGGVAVNRPGTYSWTYLVRRPRSTSPAMTEVTVVVYAGRATDTVGGESTSYTGAVMGAIGTNTVVVTYSGDKPNFRKGGWVLDTSYRQDVTKTYGTVNGYFYQVAAVTDSAPVSGMPSMTLELETPLKENVTTLVLLENVIAVLDRGPSWRP